MTPEPFGEGFLGHFSAGNGEHGFHDISLGGHNIEPIEQHENAGGDVRYSLVAIYKRMISRYAIAVTRGQSREWNRPLVVKYIARPKQCGLEQPHISNAIRPAIARNL